MVYDRPVYAGLFVPSLTTHDFTTANKMALKGGASGISLFDMGSVKDEYWPILKRILA